MIWALEEVLEVHEGPAEEHSSSYDYNDLQVGRAWT